MAFTGSRGTPLPWCQRADQSRNFFRANHSFRIRGVYGLSEKVHVAHDDLIEHLLRSAHRIGTELNSD